MKVVVGASLLGLALALPTAPALTLLGSDEPTTVVTEEGSPVETPGEPDPEATEEPEEEATDPEVTEAPEAEATDPEAEEPAESDELTAKAEPDGDRRSDEMTALAREHQEGMRAWKACVREFKPTRSKGEHPHGNCTKPTPPGHLKNDRPWHGGTTKKSADKAKHAQAPESEKAPKATPETTKPEKAKSLKPKPDKAAPKR